MGIIEGFATFALDTNSDEDDYQLKLLDNSSGQLFHNMIIRKQVLIEIQYKFIKLQGIHN